MLYFGAILVLLGAYMIWKEYAVFLDKDLSWCRAFLAALSDYREKVKCYMDTPAMWAEGYKDELLCGCGFLDGIVGGATFSEAYKEVRNSVLLTDNVDAILTSCFERLGEGYLDTELEILESAIYKLSKEEASLGESLAKRRKAVGAVVGAFAVGMIILII